MDIKAKIEEVIEKVKNDKDFASTFKKDPVKALESLIGISLPKDQINAIIDGVKAKLSMDKAGDVIGSIKKFF